MAKSLGRILAGFNKTIKELRDLEAANNNLAGQNLDTISRLNAENLQLWDEAGKANNVANKLEELVA